MCLFCIAVFAMLAGAVTGVVLDQLEGALTSVAVGGQVKRVTDSESTAVFALDVPVPQVPGAPAPKIATAPVAVTLFKKEKRLRIQVRTHDVTRAEAEAVQDVVAAAGGLTIVSRSSHATEQVVSEAVTAVRTATEPTTLGTYGTPPAQQQL